MSIVPHCWCVDCAIDAAVGGDAAKSKQEDVHAPAKNLLDQKQAVKVEMLLFLLF